MPCVCVIWAEAYKSLTSPSPHERDPGEEEVEVEEDERGRENKTLPRVMHRQASIAHVT